MERRDWLKELRLEKGLTQMEVATRVQISLRFYQMIEQGVKTPSVDNARKISNLIGFDWGRFYKEI